MNSDAQPLRCLLVEDSEDDARLLLRHLRDAGFEVTSERVETPEAMRAALETKPWDLVISDYRLPHFNGLAALELLRASGSDLPFIIVSGVIGEAVAVAAMKGGANDYMWKDNLARLAPAVRRELHEAAERRTGQQAEVALRESERRYRAVVESATDAVVTINSSGTVVSWNESAARVFGYTESEIVGQPLTAVMPQRYHDRHAAGLARAASDGERRAIGRTLELEGVNKDGHEFPIDLSLSQWETADGHFFTGIIRDTTERKQAEARIIRLGGFYAALATANEAIARAATDVDIFREVCRAAVTHGGVRMAWVGLTDVTSQQLVPIASFGDGTGYLSDIRISVRADDPYGRGPSGRAVRDGQPVWIDDFPSDASTQPWRERGASAGWRVSAALPLFRNGASVGALSLYADGGDIFDTDVRKLVLDLAADISQALDRSAARAELHLRSAALEAAVNPILITDRTGAIVWANPAFSTDTGYERHEVIGKNPRELVKSGVHDQAVYKQMWDALLEGNVWQGELTNRRKDGSRYPEEMTITPVKDAHGEITHFIAVKRDLTEEKELQAQLHQSQKMEAIGQLAGGVAHDFNNILGVIVGYGELAQRQLEPAHPVRARVDQILQAAERAAGLTHQLLAFSRKQVLQPKRLDLNAIVANTHKMLGRLLGENVNVVVHLAADLGSVNADPGQVEQVILNLAVNARDAMPDGGSLTLETANVDLDEGFAASHPPATPGPYVMLAVSDTGTGMGEETLQRIFEPFFTTKPEGHGTGLGLATVWGIVNQSGGYIWVYSEPGHGTVFKVYLPRVDAPSEPVLAPGLPAEAPRGQGETILLAEDTEILREVIAETLEDLGYTVLQAGDGEEALGVARRHEGPIALLLTDVVMPRLGGAALATRLVALRPEVRVLYMSGYTNGAISQNGVLAEGVALLEKPATADSLARAVREVLDRPAPVANHEDP